MLTFADDRAENLSLQNIQGKSAFQDVSSEIAVDCHVEYTIFGIRRAAF